MIDQHEINVLESGDGYVIGELPKDNDKFYYLKREALVCLFDGVDNALEYITKRMPKPKRDKSSSKQGSGGDFNAFNSYEEAMDTFRNHPEKVVEFDPAELRIKDESESGQQVNYDVVGDYIDMGRYMEGIPESWGAMRMGNARNRRVNILVNINHVWSTSHKDITRRGERILRLVDALEAGGVRTQVVGIESNQCGHTEILLKRHEEPLTISDLAVVGHPEFLRRIVFRINEHSKTWDYGYGSARVFSDVIDAKPELIHSDSNDEMNIVIDSSMRSIPNIDQIFDQLEKLLVWEMSKPVPEVDAVRAGNYGIDFNPNGVRDEEEVRREGLEAIKA